MRATFLFDLSSPDKTVSRTAEGALVDAGVS